MTKEKLTYSKAFSELEEIVSEIESEEIEVDTLSDKVRRAMELIRFCRGRLRTTEESVNEILEDMDTNRENPET